MAHSPPVARRAPLWIAFVAGAASLVVIPAMAAPVTFTTGTYTQNFQGFSTTAGTSSVTLQQMYDVSSLAGAGTVSGWYIYTQAGWATGNRWFAADGGASTTGGFRTLYSSSGGNLALGSQGSGNSVAFYGVILQNLSGTTINNVTLSYDAVINRNPSSTVNSAALSYRVSSTSPATSGTSAGDGTFNDLAGAWSSSSLGFSSPASGTGAPNATQAAINPMFTIGTKAGNLTGLNWANNQYLFVRWSESDEAGSDATMGVDNFSFSELVSRSLAWNLAGSGTWDTTAANWTTGSGSTTFVNADSVAFSNAAGGTISLSGTLQPTTVTIDASSGTYSFSGGVGSKISGATSISKSNAGTAVFTSANDFGGGTTISGGSVQIDAADRLGSGAITLAGGSLVSTASGSLTLTNALTVGGSGGTLNVGSQDLVINAATTLSGVLGKAGAGKLTLAGAITSNAGAGYNVTAGSLQLGTDATGSGVYKVFGSGTLTGDLILSGSQRFDVDGGAVISGPGRLQMPTSGALVTTSSGDSGGTVSAEIALNSGSASFTAGSWTGSTYSPGTFLATIGATKGATTSSLNSLTVGVISGNADVDISNSSATGGGGGQFVLNGVSTYTGNTTINTNAPDVAGTSTIKLGVDNPLPATTGVIVGTKTGLGLAVLDMNGKNLQVGYLADGANVSATKYLTVTNLGVADSVLTVGGGVTPGAAFSGVISGGTAAGSLISVLKTGTSIQTFSGPNSYAGTTTIAAGVLAVSGTGRIGTGGLNLGTTGSPGRFDIASILNGTYTLPSAATLAGVGTISGAGKSLAVLGSLEPGNSAGTITIDSGATLDLSGAASSTFQFTDPSFAPGSFDQIAGDGNVVLGGVLNLAFSGGTYPNGTSLVDLFVNTGSLTGGFTAVNATGLAAGQSASFDATTGEVTVVPEPSALAALGCAAALYAVLRRRR